MHSFFDRLRAPLAAVLLAPLLAIGLVLVGPVGQAAAAIKHSGATSAKFGFDRFVPGDWMNCTLTAFYRMSGNSAVATQSVQVRGGDCDTGPSRGLEGASLSLTFNGDTPSGASCSMALTTTLGTDEVIPNVGTDSTGLLGGLTVRPETACSVSEVCWEVRDSSSFIKAFTAGTCEALPMGAPMFPGDRVNKPADCVLFDFSGVEFTTRNDPDPFWNAPSEGRLRWYSLIKLLGPGVKAGKAYSMHIQAVYRRPDGRIEPWLFTDGLPSPLREKEGMRSMNNASNGGFANPEDEKRQLVGIQIFDWGMRPQFDAYDKLPQSAAYGHLGTSDPSVCRFYFGEKIATVDADDTDEPTGPVIEDGATPAPVDEAEPEPINEAPTGKDEPCTFSLTDPSSWLSGGMCAAVGLLGAIWDAIQGVIKAIWDLPGKLLDGLGGKLKALFVPADGYLNGKVDATRDKLDQTTPAKWWAAFSGLVPGEASGCSGIEFAPPGGKDGAPMFSERLGAACGGKMANIAQVIRLGISVAVVIGGGMACIRGLGSGFGWNPGIGRGESA